MLKLTEEEKSKLKFAGLNDSDITKIEEAGALIAKKTRKYWWIHAILGLVTGFIMGKLL